MTALVKQPKLWASFAIGRDGMPALFFNIEGRGRYEIVRESEIVSRETNAPRLKIAGETTRTYDAIGENIALARKLGLPHVDAMPLAGGPIAICGPGPGLREMLGTLATERARGVPIWALKGTWRYLVENGITPDAVVMMDAHPSQAEYAKDAAPGMQWLLASMMAPDVFRALEGQSVTLWDAAEGKGCSVAVHAALLAMSRGYSDIRLYGHDCSWEGEASHLYELANKKAAANFAPIDAIFGGRRYMTTREMCVDARALARMCRTPGLSRIIPCGRGLLPDLFRGGGDLSAVVRRT